jgi:hypothetical protein
MITQVIERARKYIAKCPVAVSGQGGHNTTFHVAAVLVHGFALSEVDGLTLIKEWNQGCVPPWSEGELVHKIQSAASAAHTEPRGYLIKGKCDGMSDIPSISPEKAKLAFNPDTLKMVARKVADIPDIYQFISERSPVVVETQDSASVLRRLYGRGSGENVVIFTDMKSQGQFLWEANQSDVTQSHHLPTGDEGVWLLPQPVNGEYHPNPRCDGKMSRRSEESVTAWRYVVLESDEADTDDWLRCLVQLPLRIACVCESGGRSIHALVRVDADSKSEWDRQILSVKPILITLGADRGALSAVRLSRLPQAQRGERVQRLLYLNSVPTGIPILRQPTQVELYGKRENEVPNE